jgi:hypothetical protein
MDNIGFDQAKEKIIASLPEDGIIVWKKKRR